MNLAEKMIRIGDIYPRLSVKNLGLILTLYDIGSAGSSELARITSNTPLIVRDQLRRLIDRGLIEFFNAESIRKYKLSKEARDVIDQVLDDNLLGFSRYNNSPNVSLPLY